MKRLRIKLLRKRFDLALFNRVGAAQEALAYMEVLKEEAACSRQLGHRISPADSRPGREPDRSRPYATIVSRGSRVSGRRSDQGSGSIPPPQALSLDQLHPPTLAAKNCCAVPD